MRDLTGKSFGKLTVQRMLQNRKCECICECGKATFTFTTNLTRGRTKSCGCTRAQSIGTAHRTHGESGSGRRIVEYELWSHMLERCRRRDSSGWGKYGARGICVHPRWHSYENFLADMGRRPSSAYSLERINNDGDYAPGNVRWATAKEQARNRRSSNIVTAYGKTMTVAEWAEESGIKYGTLWSRLMDYGWTPERAVSE